MAHFAAVEFSLFTAKQAQVFFGPKSVSGTKNAYYKVYKLLVIVNLKFIRIIRLVRQTERCLNLL